MAIRTSDVAYRDGETELEGFVAWDDSKSTAPGVLVFPDWRGVAAQVKERCRMLADLGYAALAADLYGRNIRPTTYADCMAEAGKYYNDRDALKARARAAYDVIKAQEPCDAANVSAIGYCFGALTALELARTGAELNGVVSFHGNFNTPTPGARDIKAKILVLHGDDDPLVPPQEVAAFIAEMKEYRVDYQFIAYANAVHSFTNWDLPESAAGEAAYNKLADRRSWAAMQAFLSEASA
jgi:dienelactone hydrolase